MSEPVITAITIPRTATKKIARIRVSHTDVTVTRYGHPEQRSTLDAAFAALADNPSARLRHYDNDDHYVITMAGGLTKYRLRRPTAARPAPEAPAPAEQTPEQQRAAFVAEVAAHVRRGPIHAPSKLTTTDGHTVRLTANFGGRFECVTVVHPDGAEYTDASGTKAGDVAETAAFLRDAIRQDAERKHNRDNTEAIRSFLHWRDDARLDVAQAERRTLTLNGDTDSSHYHNAIAALVDARVIANVLDTIVIRAGVFGGHDFAERLRATARANMALWMTAKNSRMVTVAVTDAYGAVGSEVPPMSRMLDVAGRLILRTAGIRGDAAAGK